MSQTPETPNLKTAYSEIQRDLDVARATFDATQEWTNQFEQATSQLETTGGLFLTEGTFELPSYIPTPALRVTPRVYRVVSERFGDIYGYLSKDPQAANGLFTTENDDAWHTDISLLVDPIPLSLDEYVRQSLESDSPHDVSTSWEEQGGHPTFAQEVAQTWEDKLCQPYMLKGFRPPVVIRALGKLPTQLTKLSDTDFAFDLRIDPLLNRADEEPSQSARIHNLASTYGWRGRIHDDPYDPEGWMTFYQNDDSMPHVPALIVGPNMGHRSHGQAEHGDRDFDAALYLPSYNSEEQSLIMVFKLIGSPAVAGAAEQV